MPLSTREFKFALMIKTLVFELVELLRQRRIIFQKRPINRVDTIKPKPCADPKVASNNVSKQKKAMQPPSMKTHETKVKHFHLKFGKVTVYHIGESNNISIVIPVREGMPANLESVMNQTYSDFEVIIITGRGTPSSSSARNLGVILSSGKFVVFLDDDAYPRVNWLEKLVSAYKKSGGDIIDSHEAMHESSRFSGFIFEQTQLKNLQKKSTANFALIPKHVFAQVGLYDERFKKFGFNEIDFSIRVRRSGFIIRHCSKAVIEHRSEPRRLRNFVCRNLFYFSLKHPIHALTLSLAYPPLLRNLWKRYIYQHYKM